MLLRDKGIRVFTSPEPAKYPGKPNQCRRRTFTGLPIEAYLGWLQHETDPFEPGAEELSDLLRPEFKGKPAVTTESSSARV
jgi:hypothetical protein